jgi:hypothetical protein
MITQAQARKEPPRAPDQTLALEPLEQGMGTVGTYRLATTNSVWLKPQDVFMNKEQYSTSTLDTRLTEMATMVIPMEMHDTAAVSSSAHSRAHLQGSMLWPGGQAPPF